MAIPNDYIERVYAGVLGKLIGVYLGRPFEQWSYQRIMEELGPIEYYVHEKLNQPLVVTDDDVAGTFTFIRALEDNGVSPDITAEQIGKAWLNYIIEERSILWWGGAGNSTEHTAWLNLDRGIPAPQSGSIAQNGRTVAEQIGAQIFIDGWAMVAPGQPKLAAKLAEQAGKVSHDGEAVHAAMLWAAMEAEAFVSKDVGHLIETGLSVIPGNSLIARLIGEIRQWQAEYEDWRDTRQKIEDHHGYAKYPGNCHVVPNHALMIMSLLYAPHDFHRGQMIINTSGWDTDCNAGNLGCLQGIMLGLDGIDNGPDWRGPIADRMLISSADGGNGITDAVRQTYYLAGLGRGLAGAKSPSKPKNGARFHFSLPGSRQGFVVQSGEPNGAIAHLDNVTFESGRALELRFDHLATGQAVAATTPTFQPRDVVDMRTYDLMATPLLYPGQTIKARVIAGAENSGPIDVALRLRQHEPGGTLKDIDGEPHALAPGEDTILEWTVPDIGSMPIGEVGVSVHSRDRRADGAVVLDYLTWSGTPHIALTRPEGNCDFWYRAWVNDTDIFSRRFPQSFRISHGRGTGKITYGTRDWTDYSVSADLIIHSGEDAGLIVRSQGRRRYYAARLTRDDRFQIVRVYDGDEQIVADSPLTRPLEDILTMTVTAGGNVVRAEVGNNSIEAVDESQDALADGGIGLMVTEGAVSAEIISVRPL
ncbi:ADP-ribosylglycohydrolase family protein [Bauldia sp.]|uniref:ADP-ribosylglycohydrolase family protein n=1 Tax=Bauldia sp. TaxID=2575872 RepID=UPI003BACCEDB